MHLASDKGKRHFSVSSFSRTNFSGKSTGRSLQRINGTASSSYNVLRSSGQ
jgi:hypothetical protein